MQATLSSMKEQRQDINAMQYIYSVASAVAVLNVIQMEIYIEMFAKHI